VSALPCDTAAPMQGAAEWTPVCRLDEIVPDTGVCALVGDEQVAIFRLGDDSLHALGNFDPCSDANVLSRGIVGDVRGERVVASPIYKQHFAFATGRCLEEPECSVPVYAVRLDGETVCVGPRIGSAEGDA
jgi:NAD(P)H-dependent nitrite reductase small subunit